MSESWFFDRALPVISGIGVTIAVSLLGFLAPIVYGQVKDIQKLTDQVENIGKSVDKFEATSDRLDKHMTETEADPSRVLAQTLGTTVTNRKIGASLVVGGNIVVFPKDTVAQSDLVRAGYVEQEFSPTISGYVAKKVVVEDPLQRPGR